MKKRIITTLSIAVSAVILLAGCQFTVGSAGTKPVDLTNANVISALCGDNAEKVHAIVASAADAQPTSGKRKTLTKWGITDPTDDATITSILNTLDERAQVECATASSVATTDDTKLSQELLDFLDASYAEPGVCAAIVAAAGLPVVEGYYDLLLKALYKVDANGDPENTLEWSDALSTYLPGNTAEEKYTSLKVAICTEPVVGVALAHLFAHLEVKGNRVLDLQTTEWLAPYNVQDKQINDLIATFFPNFNVKEGSRTAETDAAALAAMTSYQDLADNLLYLVSRYQLVDVRAIDSTHHYHQVAGGLTADGIPEIEVSSELDNRPALVFFLTEKTACVPISVLAFNVGDKRPELANIPANCDTFIPPTVTPGCTVDCGGTPHTPGCVTNCEPAPTCPDGWDGTYPVCKAPFTEGSGETGNAPDGSGDSVDPGSGTYEPTPPVIVPYVEKPPVAPTPPTVKPETPKPTSPPVDTGGQGNDGVVPVDGSGGGTCNPVVMSC